MVSEVGFIGLGHMGSALASNLVAAGFSVVAHDAAGPAKCPDRCSWAGAAEEVAARAGTVVFSLPDGPASGAVARSLSTATDVRTTHVIDTSTIGVRAAESICSLLGQAGIAYVDAPVSGGVAGARARTLMVMYAGDEADCDHVKGVLGGLSDRRQRVGDRPGMAQALKLANNFLSASALAATSEAISFGLSVGLDMATMLDVLNGASGQSQATTDKFPHHVLTGRYSSGFANSLMSKDVRLYMQEVQARLGPHSIATVTYDVWRRFAEAEPGADFTRIFPFVADSGGGPVGGGGQ
jgi:3-hydroxyisobutyrate dehydrogenase-like beta-hydroxyacid dehydrogenase